MHVYNINLFHTAPPEEPLELTKLLEHLPKSNYDSFFQLLEWLKTVDGVGSTFLLDQSLSEELQEEIKRYEPSGDETRAWNECLSGKQNLPQKSSSNRIISPSSDFFVSFASLTNTIV